MGNDEDDNALENFERGCRKSVVMTEDLYSGDELAEPETMKKYDYDEEEDWRVMQENNIEELNNRIPHPFCGIDIVGVYMQIPVHRGEY